MMRHLHTISASMVLLALAGAPASAQDALGDGRALDNNLQQGQRYNPAGRNIAEEVRFRNAIVTGNAPGGLSFRGDVGYTSPREFRGVLGADETFAFRRDSLYSGLAGAGIRGTDALQYQFALTTGSRPPQNLTGSLTYSRDGLPSTAGGFTQRPSGVPTGVTGASDPVLAQASAEEQTTPLTSILRSTGAYDATRGYQPYLLTTLQTDTTLGDYALSANPLRGLRVSPFAAPEDEDDRAAPANRVTTAYDELLERVQIRARTFAEENRPARPGEVEARVEPPEPTDPDWAERMRELRRQLLGQPAAGEEQDAGQPGNQPGGLGTGEGAAGDGGDAQQPRNPPRNPGRIEGRDSDNDIDPEDETPRSRSMRFDPDTMRMIRDDGGQIDRLAGDAVNLSDQYVLHMRSGESALERRRYFDAEERFTLAVSIRPGDVSAQVGRVHAQLGAGLLQSAGINLREVLVMGPEVAGARFSGRLLPSAERVTSLKRMLRENIGVEEGRRDAPGQRIVRESGLLLAYLGHQSRDRLAIEQGLEAWAKAIERSASEGNDEASDEALHRFLLELWLAPGAQGSGDDAEGGDG